MAHRTHLPLVRVAALVAVIAGAAIAVPAAATDRVVIVQPGDTLSEIALKEGVSLAQLKALNGIADANRIYAGQRLRVTGKVGSATAATAAAAPAARIHVVARGETLSGIARHYGSTVTAIAKANGITRPSLIRAGQRLAIPGQASALATVATAPAVAAPAPRVHVVARGETLSGIAKHYGSTVTAIAKANGITRPSLIRVGQRLTIPGSAAPSAGMMPASIASSMAGRADVAAIIRASAKAHGVPVAFALAVAWQESGWRANVVSHAGAVGVMQLTPATAEWVATTMLGHGIKLRDARSNVEAGVVLLRHYLDRYHGDRRLTLAAYYQGQTATDRHGVYRMTRPYIASILALEKLLGG